MYSIAHLKQMGFPFRGSFLASHIESLFLTKSPANRIGDMEDFMKIGDIYDGPFPVFVRCGLGTIYCLFDTLRFVPI